MVAGYNWSINIDFSKENRKQWRSYAPFDVGSSLIWLFVFWALQAVKVYAVGGYFDGDSNSKQSKMSKETIEEALKVLKSSDIHFELKLLCCYKANTGTNGRPIHMGVAFSVSEGRVFPAYLEDFFGPDSCVRAAFQGYNTEGYKRDLTLIFEPEREELRLKPFEVVMNKPYFKNLLRLDDYNLLQRSSTSPEVEPANFASNQREKLSFLLENHPFMKNLFNGGRSVRVHKLTKENGVYVWKLTLVDVKV